MITEIESFLYAHVKDVMKTIYWYVNYKIYLSNRLSSVLLSALVKRFVPLSERCSVPLPELFSFAIGI